MRTLTFDVLAAAMRGAFMPQDVQQRYMTSFLATKQGGRSVDDYALAFR